MPTHDATCKFCGSKLKIEIDASCPPIRLDLWLAIAAHNRCADYRMAIIKVIDSIGIIANVWASAKLLGKHQAAEIHDRTRDSLADTVSFLDRAIHKRWGFFLDADPLLPDAILERPDMATGLVRNHIARSERAARDRPTSSSPQRPTAPDP